MDSNVMEHEIRPSTEQLVHALAMACSSDSIRCPFCDKSFTNRGARHFHMSKKHGEQPLGNNDVGRLEAILGIEPVGTDTHRLKFCCPMSECTASNIRFRSAKLLVQHFQKKHTEKRHQCGECSLKFALERDLRYHSKKLCRNRVKTMSSLAQSAQSTKNPQQIQQQEQSASPILLLVPIRIERIDCQRILPNRPIEKRTTSTQTDDEHRQQTSWMPNDILGPETSEPIYCDGQFSDQAAYYDSSRNTKMIAEQDFSMPNNHGNEFLHVQNAYAQTSFPQTLDFSAQYPSSSSSIYLPPLLVASSTQTHHHHPSSMDLIDYDCNNGLGKCGFPLKRQSSWTQTMLEEDDVRHWSTSLLMDSSNSEMASVGAQTELSWQ